MTDLQHDLIKRMISRKYYLMGKKSHTGRDGFMLYSGKQVPEQWYSDKCVKIIRRVLKKDKLRRFTLNLSLVRQQHGRSLIKKLYKRSGSTKVTY